MSLRPSRRVVVLARLASIGALGAAGSPALASLTLLSGPQLGSHTGNLVTNGSFEFGPNPPNDGVGPINRRFWATGTTSAPFSIPTGWSSSGNQDTYATWGNDGAGPNYTIQQSGILPDGRLGMYFGNGTGVTSDMPPTFQANGQVTFPGTPTITSPKGAPAVLWQSVPTDVNIAPSYILSFWVSGEFSGGTTPIDPGIFGLRVTNVLAGDPIQFLTVPGDALVSKRYEYSFTPLVPSAPVTVEFTNWGHFNLAPWGGPGFTTELVLDDVMVNMVPGPGAMGLLGAAMMAGVRRRRR